MMKELKDIYSKLADEESKDIFEWRLLYSITGREEFMDRIIRKYVFPTGWDNNGVLAYLLWGIEEYQEEYPLVVYGCGEFGTKIYKILGKKVACFCDRDENKQKNGFLGERVISLEELVEKKEEYRVVIGSMDYYFDIYRVLQEHGIKQAVDNSSKVKEWYDVISRQYFERNIITYGNNEVFVDGGCLNYGTAKQLLEECSSVKKIYAFEPDPENFIKCKKAAESMQLHSYEIIQKGLYSENAELRFNAAGNGISGISNEGNSVIKVCAIDEIIKEPITFIKMDIEGGELDALKGAAETIKKYHPKLAICIYHKPEDVIEIPKYILELNPDYKLYMRHYSNFAGETIVYAV